jgi:hypothetical protein
MATLRPAFEDAGDVAVGGVMRQAAHRHAVARGEREVEQLRAGLRVLEKHLVKIAEAEEQQRVLRQFAFDAAILRHHGRELGFGGRGGRPGLPSDFNAFLRIGEDGRVTCFTGKIEMGQGPITSLPQMLAEELDVPLDTVDIIMGDTDLCPWDHGHVRFDDDPHVRSGAPRGGGRGKSGPFSWNWPPKRSRFRKRNWSPRTASSLTSKTRKSRITYGQLAKGQKIERHLQAKPAKLKDPAQFTIAGQSLLRRDGEAKVTGKAHYAADIRVPGHALCENPAAAGARCQIEERGHAPAKADRRECTDRAGRRSGGGAARISRRGGRRPGKNQGRVRPAGGNLRRQKHF